MEFKFKVGDLVEVDYESKQNKDLLYPSFSDVYEVVHVYQLGVDGTPFVKIKGAELGFFEDRFKLAKNTIVKSIIADL